MDGEDMGFGNYARAQKGFLDRKPTGVKIMDVFSMSENQNQGVMFSIDQSLTIVKMPIKLTL